MRPGGSVPTAEPTVATAAGPAPAWQPPVGSAKPWRQSITLGVLALAGTAYTAAVDPNTSHAFPLCPLRYFTHMDCPLCGGLRSVHALTHGDLLAAVDHNILFVLTLPFLLLAYGLWLGRTLGLDWPAPKVSTRAMSIAVIALAAYGVARNLPIPGHDLLNSTSMLARNRP